MKHVITIVGLAMVLAAGAHARPGEGDAGRDGFLKRLLENPELAAQLELTDEQRTTLRKSIYTLERERVELEAEMRLAGLKQAELVTAEEVDEKAVMAAIEKAGAARTEIAKSRMRGMLLMKRTLTDEQRSKIPGIMKQQRRAMMERDRGMGERGTSDRAPGREMREGQGRRDGEMSAEVLERRRAWMEKRQREGDRPMFRRARPARDTDTDHPTPEAARDTADE